VILEPQPQIEIEVVGAAVVQVRTWVASSRHPRPQNPDCRFCSDPDDDPAERILENRFVDERWLLRELAPPSIPQLRALPLIEVRHVQPAREVLVDHGEVPLVKPREQRTMRLP
jgi:hypothetical protein